MIFLHRIGLLGGYPSTQYLLDLYSGAAAAYSLRVLSSSFASSAVVRVRRSSDNAEADFTATEITDGTLTTWTGANDGFVVTWYDQSGNSRDATQATAGNQPQIVASGVVETGETGKPLINVTSSSQFLLGPNINTASGSTSVIFTVHKHSSSVVNGNIIGTTGQSQYLGAIGDGSTSTVLDGSAASVTYRKNGLNFSGSTRDDMHTFYFNGALNLAEVKWENAGVWPSSFRLWSYPITSFVPTGFYGEWVHYPSDQSANRTGIETNINDHYSIY